MTLDSNTDCRTNYPSIGLVFQYKNIAFKPIRVKAKEVVVKAFAPAGAWGNLLDNRYAPRISWFFGYGIPISELRVPQRGVYWLVYIEFIGEMLGALAWIEGARSNLRGHGALLHDDAEAPRRGGNQA